MTASGPILLLVEDDEAARQALAAYLDRRGYRVDQAGSAHEAFRAWDQRRADLVVLDLGLPDLDGVQVVRRIRREGSTPIIILSGRDDERDKVDALEAGADDYVAKPFAIEELNARIRAVLRRAAGPDATPDGRVRVGSIEFDALRREVRVAGQQVALTPREFELLRVLLSHRGRVVTKGRLLREVWGLAYAGESQYLHVYVNRLRRKLAASAPGAGIDRVIRTEPGVGYRIAEPEG
jgi:two-component system, OmpR family, KDP operon response regulator KdpE